MLSLKLPTTWEALAKLHKLIELEDKIKRLESEIEEVGKAVRDTPIAREIGFFVIRVRRLQDWCFTAHFSLLDGYNVPEISIANLEREYKILKEEWIRFIRNNNLGVIWL
jgi:chaperonin cofactor prefoldin